MLAKKLPIKRLLKDKHFKKAVDVGGGYGRLCPLLKSFSDEVTLAEPSAKQLKIAKEFLKNYDNIKSLRLEADNLKFPANSVDLLTMIRVMHHLPDPNPTFKELHRVLSDDGYLILEVANSAHFLNKIRFLIKLKKIPNEPIDIRSKKNRNSNVIPFVNHNPKTVIKELHIMVLRSKKYCQFQTLETQILKKLFQCR